MDWLEIVNKIFDLCIIPLFGLGTAYFIAWLKTKRDEALIKIDNDTADKYVAMLFDTVATCVSATTQTYVDALKKQGKFDAEAQKVAFKLTYDAVIATLTDEAKEYLVAAYGDLTAFLTARIEAEVKA
jgi:hypothetical protein